MNTQANLISKSALPLYKQLTDHFITAINKGELRPGEAVPSTYQLCEQFGVSRVTAVRTYEELKSWGFLTAVRGGRTVVNPELAERKAEPELLMAPSRDWPVIEEETTAIVTPGDELVPHRTWLKLYAKVVSEHFSMAPERHSRAHLSVVLARWLQASRGIQCSGRNVLVFPSLRHALLFVSDVFIRKGDSIAIENPSNPLVRELYQAAGATLSGIPVDLDGPRPEQATIGADTKLVHVSPLSQVPMGVIMSSFRRKSLITLLEKHQTTLIEEDTVPSYRYVSGPRMSMFGEYEKVVHIGSMQSYLGSLSPLAYVVVSDSLLPLVANSEILFTSAPQQLDLVVLAEFISSGKMARLIQRNHAHLARQRTALLVSILEAMRAGVSFSGGHSGVAVPVRFKDEVPISSILNMLTRMRVFYESASRYYLPDTAPKNEFLVYFNRSRSDCTNFEPTADSWNPIPL